ncbi:xanthine dehydrogenase family protein molybdopterin-binding subunit [Nocardioides sp. T5]|uniref:xanthine dehydrogenase family protein molybdopterin-binding subunit n=1 Tax=Nocardioides sp. T5 TaxID=3400182 RepID=UPI003A89624E
MLDARDRVTGRTPYVINHDLPGMLHCQVVRSTLPHARILEVDTSQAAAAPGVRAVVSGQDLRAMDDVASRFGPVLADQPVLAHDVVRYVGEPVVAVVAETAHAAARAAELVEVTYEPMPAVFDAIEACSGQAPILFTEVPERDPMFVDITLRADHDRNICNTFTVERGDVEAGFAQADHVFDEWYDSPAVGAVPLETHAVVADWRADGVTVWSNTQTPHIVRRQLALLLRTTLSRVRVIVPAVGGGFGAKAYAAIEPVAVLMSKVCRAPVRMHLRRDEEFVTMTKHAMKVRLRTGVTAEGVIVAREATAYYNAGAYATISPRKVMFAGYGLNGPYRIPNVRINAHAVLTNTPPAGAYRGFAINQAAWAYENQMDTIAEHLGIDAVDLRRRNLLVDGDTFCTGEQLDHLNFVDMLDTVAEKVGWGRVPAVERDGDVVRAWGVSAVIEGTITPSTSAAAVRVNDDGSVVVLTSSVEMGQGIRSALAYNVAAHLGVFIDDVQVSYVDTDLTPYDQQTTASRSAFSMGEALGRASEDLIEKIRHLAAGLLEAPVEEIEFDRGAVQVRGVPDTRMSMADVIRRTMSGDVLGEGTFTTSGGLDPFTGQGIGSAHWHQSIGAAQVAVDLGTGRVTLERYHGAVFAGKVIDPVGAQHQCEGCLLFGVGNALFEELVYTDGQLVNGSLADYMVPTMEDLPTDRSFDLVEDPERGEPHGLGEPALPPIAPAMSNAVYRATGVRVTSLPLTSERVYRALQEAKGSTSRTGAEGGVA